MWDACLRLNTAAMGLQEAGSGLKFSDAVVCTGGGDVWGRPPLGRPSLRWPILSAGADRSALPHRPDGGPQRTALLDQPRGDLAPPSCLQCQPRPSSHLRGERALPGDLAQPQEGCPSSTLGPLPAGPARDGGEIGLLCGHLTVSPHCPQFTPCERGDAGSSETDAYNGPFTSHS